MYKKSQNKYLFAIFILIILLIIAILIIAVYNSKGKNNEEYKISLNSIVYDEYYSYINLDKDGVLKKEWDNNYYLYSNNGDKYSLGNTAVFYDKVKDQVTMYGTIYQVFTNGEISEKTEKTIVSNLSNFQFFKLDDREYIIIGDKITGVDISTSKYLIVSIDKAGNALLINDEMNVKTINPLILEVSNIKFDIAQEKLIISDEEIDLKKINGSSNEYVKKDDNKNNNSGSSTGSNNVDNSDNNATTNNNTTNNNQVYNDILNQIINFSQFLPNSGTGQELYKNIGLRSVVPGASYIDATYSIIDPESKYLSVYLTLTDEEDNITYYNLSKDSSYIRITGLKPNKQYNLTLNYKQSNSNEPLIADSVIVLTNNNPTKVRIVQIDDENIRYQIKMYNEYEFEKADVVLTDCNGNQLYGPVSIEGADAAVGYNGIMSIQTIKTRAGENDLNWLCLILENVEDVNGESIIINSYHKIKIS